MSLLNRVAEVAGRSQWGDRLGGIVWRRMRASSPEASGAANQGRAIAWDS